MKMLKYLVFTLIASVMVTVRASPIQPKTSFEFEIIQLEEACVRQGGLCVHPDECKPGNLAQLPGLCPLQEHRGIQCCYLCFRKEPTPGCCHNDGQSVVMLLYTLPECPACMEQRHDLVTDCDHETLIAARCCTKDAVFEKPYL